jgi:DNA-binding transcriptional LysR family regulator
MRHLALTDLDAFAAVARHRSFRKAAAERGVSASTLSQALRDLEAQLGVRLLNRTTRSVAPTEAGARLLARLAPALADIAAAVDQAADQDGSPAGTVRINAPEPAIDLVLAPMIGAFLAAYPKVRLEVVGESRLIDIVEDGYDIGVRWGESLARDMIAVPLAGRQRFAVVGSPDLIARVGAPTSPRDLLARPCLRQLFPSGRRPAWEFERGGEVVRIDPDGPLVSTSIALQRRAALAGVGFWSAFEAHVRDDVAAGRLVEVLAEWNEPFPSPLLYYASRRHMPAAVRAFIDFAKAWRGDQA